MQPFRPCTVHKSVVYSLVLALAARALLSALDIPLMWPPGEATHHDVVSSLCHLWRYRWVANLGYRPCNRVCSERRVDVVEEMEVASGLARRWMEHAWCVELSRAEG